MRTVDILIGEKKKTFVGPSTWSEVSQDMSLKLFNLVKAASTKKHLLFAVPMLVYGIPLSVMKLFIDARIAARNYQAATDSQNWETLVLMGEDLLESTRWVFSEDPPATWLLKHINVNGRFQDSCSDRLHDLTLGDFIFMEDFAVKDPAKLCAAIFQKRGWWPGKHKRQPIVHDDVEKYAKTFRTEKFNTVRSMVAWNYAGMIIHLKKVFPQVFGTGPTSSDKLAVETPAKSNWIDAALSFAENDPIKFHALEKENLYVALKMIDNRIKLNKERESAMKKK